MTDFPRPRRTTYAGLFLVTLATLMHEILLTRIFSVALWYHFAFMAISVAMFGMTAGAILVYLRPNTFTNERAPYHLALNALGYGLSLVLCTVAFLQLPLDSNPDMTPTAMAFWAVGYLIIAIPFVFSGVTVAIALTKFPAHINRLYAADLIGAAIGCLLLIWTLEIAGGATTLLVVSVFATAGAALFALPLAGHRIRKTTLFASIGLAAFSLYHGVLERKNEPVIEITDALKNPVKSFRYVRWNSHSRVGVSGDPSQIKPAPGWGFSEKTTARQAPSRYMVVTIDTFAATPITYFTGDTSNLWYLKDDVTNMVHYIRNNADVAIVGVGGGRDVLGALTFNQNSVLGVELNDNVLRAITGEFAAFSGRLAENPKVTLVHDEARSFITRSEGKFDIIQLSLIDTFAATAAGAFVLAENALYTADAWTTFLKHLKPRGVLTVSRWFYPLQPAEALRLSALARASLAEIGVTEPHRHVILVKAPRANGAPGDIGSGVANILVSRDPFSSEDVAIVRREAQRLGFDIIASPEGTEHFEFREVLFNGNPEKFYASYPLDLSPPTDDRPFFFHMLRFKDFRDPLVLNFLDPNHGQLKAIRLLFGLLVIVSVLTALCLIVPLVLATKRSVLKGNASLLAYFFAIGLGFMFVELSQMQRLMVLLGHPTYALSVVLFTLLIGTGIGSYLSARIVAFAKLGERGALGALVGVLAAFGLLTPKLVDALAGATTPVRVLTAASMLFIAGLFLGLPFPLGMRRASDRAGELMPWLWGINGAASVLCTVVAATIALSYGITTTFWVGVACYVVAAVTLPRPRAAST